jgi:hypothetical protein
MDMFGGPQGSMFTSLAPSPVSLYIGWFTLAVVDLENPSSYVNGV